ETYCFDHEKLDVYREAIAFITWLSVLLEGAVRVGDVKDQLDRASTSIPLNIAEGNGKYAPKDRCRNPSLSRAPNLILNRNPHPTHSQCRAADRSKITMRIKIRKRIRSRMKIKSTKVPEHLP